MRLPKRVIIIGGTHGNEWTGITILQNYQDFLKNKFPELKIEFIFANPEAYKIEKRFKDEDLNRACQFLNENRSSYEHKRAIEIQKIIQEEPCIVIDLHTTTSNMGNTLIISNENAENLTLAGLVQENLPETKILLAPDLLKKYLISQSRFGLMIEVGPVPNNVIRPGPLKDSLNLLISILSKIHNFRAGISKVEVYEEACDVYYPKNHKNELTACIHEDIEGNDFIKLPKTFKAFQSFNGEEIQYEANEEMYPIFINEAAYYPSRLAFTLCRKIIKNI
jgi:succinylglutamate desuccinylase